MALLHRPFFSKVGGTRESLRTLLAETIQASKNKKTFWRPRLISFQGSLKFVRSYRITPTGATMENKELPSNYLKDKLMAPNADPPRDEDVNLLYQFFEKSSKLVVLTGAGISTESGIPDYRSPNGAYSTGFRPITHQEFMRSSRARRRYWARSYAGWRKFTTAQPGPAHIALASLEKAGRVKFMMTQNVDRLHHRAGSNPLELHGTVYVVACTNCGFSLSRSSFQDQVKALNPKWAEAIESLDYDSRSDKSFGMKQRPDGDIEIDEKFWEEEFHIPDCEKCNGILKPDVVFFGDNVPKGRSDRAIEASKECDAFLVLGSSLMTMSAFRLIRAAHEAGAATAIVNIGVTRADDFVPLKINSRLGEDIYTYMGVKGSTLRKAVSFGSRKRLGGPPRGYIPVAVGVEDDETKRFMVETKALSNAEFLQFLRISAEEYGFCNQGILRIQYDAKAFEEWLRTTRKHRDFRIQPATIA